MKIAIVILNWNGKKFLQDFLPHVIRYNQLNAEIIVADNGSTDDSIKVLRENFPEVKILEFPVNSGFAKGYNDALKKVEADTYVLLNSDVEVTENWIAPVIKMMENDLSLAACQPKIKSFHQKNLFEYAGAAGGYLDYFGYPFCRGRIFNFCEEDNQQYNDSRKIFWATGACMFVRAKVFHELNGFDEEFFAHMEEIDLCWRMQRAGHSVGYCAEASVYHLGGGTLNRDNPRKTYFNFRNNLMMCYKNLPSGKLFFFFFFRIIFDFAAALKFMSHGSWGSFRAVFRAYGYFISHFGNQKLKRKNDKLPKTPLEQLPVYFKCVMIDYFLRGNKKFSQLKF